VHDLVDTNTTSGMKVDWDDHSWNQDIPTLTKFQVPFASAEISSSNDSHVVIVCGLISENYSSV
jgi:hypothetical protein